jgi:5'-nucleotidase
MRRVMEAARRIARRVHFAAVRKLACLFVFMAVTAHADTTVTLLQFSDYHSHALPFFTDDGADQGGIARAIGYIKREKKKGALAFSGGDMINKGSPAWSDKYGCAEWPWLNGVIDAMAFGNHDADYGPEAFAKCKAQLRYPILSANTSGMQRYAVLETKGIRIGVFALAGRDFPSLVKSSGLTFTDPTAAAREVVRELREKEKVAAVVMIGHQQAEDDFVLAREVPGIDVIFGSHSHRKEEPMLIEGTTTLFISPSQYLTYIARADMTFKNGRLAGVRGTLVPVGRKLPEDKTIAKKVAAMQKELESDPQYKELFAPIGKLSEPLPTAALAKRIVDLMAELTKAAFAISTASTFRQPLPAGTITMETLRAALPYDNEIVVAEMKGADLHKIIALGEAKRGSDSAGYMTHLHHIDHEKTYRVATTDYVAFVASGYKIFFKDAKQTGFKARGELAKTLSGAPPPSAAP